MVTRAQFETWLKAIEGADAKARQDAERRLAMLPRAFILEHLPSLWQESEQRRTRNRKVGVILIGLYIALIIGLPLAKLFFRKKGVSTELIPSPVIFMFIGPILSALRNRNHESSGIIHVLMQHQYPELVPILIDALPIVRKENPGATANVVQDSEVMDILALLLPRYAAMDLPDLSRKQYAILRNQLRYYSKKLRNANANLTDTESAFLAAILAFLQRERVARNDRQTAQIVEDLALERVDVARECPENRQVREAARQAIIRLYG